MEAIAEGSADYAVLPIENSSAGIVADNYDLLVNFENYIVGEQIVKCEHALIGLPGTKLEEIKTVYSHPQALAQCAEYLERHPKWRQIPYDNTGAGGQEGRRRWRLHCRQRSAASLQQSCLGLRCWLEYLF